VELRKGARFDLPGQVLDGAFHSLHGEAKAFFTGEAFPGTRMEHEVLRAQRERLLDFGAESGYGAVANGLGL
jgi:hypothetical protein